MKRIMLNTNVYCRPFDDKTDPIIKNESIFSEKILQLAENKEVGIVTSDILYGELNLITDPRKRDVILNEIESVTQERVKVNDEIHTLAGDLNDLIADYSDSLHIVFAATSNCDSFITCDKQLIKIRGKIEKFLLSEGFELAILTPEEFINSFG